MKKIVLSLFVFLSLCVKAQTTFQNPILTGMNPDPSICRVGDDFYLVTSTFEYFPGLPLYHSTDLIHWKMISYVLTTPTQLPLMGCDASVGGLYAPTIRYNNGTFYVVCTNYGGQGTQGSFYVTAKNPAGPWSEPNWVNHWACDPSLLFANDSVYYTFPDNGGFAQASLNVSTGKFNSVPKMIAQGTGSSSPEGPHLYKINGYYYLMSAEGGTGYQHMEVIQRSKSPWGPFTVNPNNPVVSHKDAPKNQFQAIGHADLFQLKDSSWWLVCLGIRPVGGNYHHLGRETFLAPVTWDSNGWPKVGTDGIVPLQLNSPNLPKQVWDKDSIRDDFDSLTLGLPWNFIRNPHNSDWSLTAKKGYLRLQGSAINFKEKNSPAFICRRQTAFNMVASTKLSFTPTKETEEAGLVVRGDDKNQFDFLVTMFNGERVIMLRQYLKDQITGIQYKTIDNADVILRVGATDLEYSFWIQQEGKPALLIGTTATKSLSTEVIGGFTGTYIGMYASGNGSSNTNPADFDWFDYETDSIPPYSWSIGTVETQNGMATPVVKSITALSYNKVQLKWNVVSNATSYVIERYNSTTMKYDSIGTTNVNDTIFTNTGLIGSTLYLYRIKAKNNNAYSLSSISNSVLTLQTPGPYSGTAAQIPGKVEVENYDTGGLNVSYFDTDLGNALGQYRTDDVDIEIGGDTGNNTDIGCAAAGEWLLYTVDVNDTIADIQFRVASSWGGGLKLELDSTELCKTSIAVTGGWQNWKTLSFSNIKLKPGKNKKLKLSITGGGFNINWINFSKVSKTGFNNVNSDVISIYPNPTTNSVKIKSIFEYSKVEIFNSVGQCVLTKELQYAPENVLQFNLSSGVYFFTLSNANTKETVIMTIK